MTSALAWIRTSEGSDDDIGLQLQRDEIPELADNLADEVDKLDLKIHTGFTRFSESHLPLKDAFLDEHSDVQAALQRVKKGEYDYIVAWDETRICRDPFFWVIMYYSRLGDCEFRFVEDVPDDELVFAVSFMVQYFTKLKEIRKAHEAKLERREQGMPDGRPPFGLQYNSTKTDYEPDPDEYPTALKVLKLADTEESQRGIARQVDTSRRTVRRVISDYREDIERFRDAWEQQQPQEI